MKRSRRRFLRASLGLATLGLLGGCGLPPRPGARAKVPRIGVLMIGSAAAPQVQAYAAALRQGLEALGHVEGRTLAVEWRHAEGEAARVPELAAELAGRGVDLIVAQGGADPALKRAVTATPLVIATMGNPVGTGIVESLARPGGNITGLSLNSSQIGGKHLELLKEVAPGIARVAVLLPASTPPATADLAMREREATARALGLDLLRLPVGSAGELGPAFEAAATGGADALTSTSSSFLTELRASIVGLAARHRLPVAYPQREFVEAGGLLAYGADLADLWRRAAAYVDKILKGADPAGLPVEQASRFDLVVNAGAARAIGLAIPESVIAQATEVIA